LNLSLTPGYLYPDVLLREIGEFVQVI
jgi:hypothetical protein